MDEKMLQTIDRTELHTWRWSKTPRFKRQRREGRNTQRRDLDGARAEERDDDSDAVDSELKLKELGDTVVDITTPHDRLDDTREVIIGQDDVRRLLRHVRARYTLHVPQHSRVSLSRAIASLSSVRYICNHHSPSPQSVHNSWFIMTSK